jgi:6-phosphofructokinase 1
MKKRVLVVTTGGDCPGLNAVIRAIVKKAGREKNWEVLGSIEGYHGLLQEPMEIIQLDSQRVSGIHVMGGSIIRTTNKGGPFNWPIKNPDGSWTTVDRSDELVRRLQYQNIEAVICIGGDGSQKISQQLFEKGVNIVGVPKTIDNDLSCTDLTFGFQTAVEVATDAVDKLVTTATSHSRTMLLEVMGRDAGWIALNAAVAGGAHIALIPEIPYDINKVVGKIQDRLDMRKEFTIIVVAEGAKSIGGDIVGTRSSQVGYENIVLGGIGRKLMGEIKKHLDIEMRVTILGHLQRGGIPIAYDRILATQFGVKAFEMVLEGKYGQMAAYKGHDVISVPITEAIAQMSLVTPDNYLVKTARGIGICLGD